MANTAVTIALTADAGIYQGTKNDGSGNIALDFQSLRSPFPGDSYWGRTGTGTWTISVDSTSVTVPSGGENYLLGYADLTGDGYTSVTYRITLQGDNPDGTSNIQFTVTDSTGATIANDNPSLPTGTFGPKQYTFTATATGGNTIAHVTLEAFAHAGTTITVSNAPLTPSTGGTPGAWGTWISEVVDLWKTANVPITKTGLGLTLYKFYYGDMSNVDGASSVAHSIDALSKFPYLVCNEPGQNTGRAPGVQQQLVASGILLFGYVDIGVSVSENNYCLPSVAAVLAAIDRCAAAGYYGVFFDGAGSQGSNPMEYIQYLVNYCHAKGLYVFPNSHPQAILYTTPDSYQIANPALTPTVTAVTDATSTLPAGTYTVGVTFTASYTGGETLISPTTTVVIASGEAIAVTTTENQHNAVSNVLVYISDAAGSSTIRKALVGYGAGEHIIAVPASTEPIPPTVNTAWTGNHNGIYCGMTRGDSCLLESFYSTSNNVYDTSGGTFAGAFAFYAEAAALAIANGVGLVGLAYALTSIPTNSTTDWETAYTLALGLGFTGLCYGSQSLSQDTLEWQTPPTFPAFGSKIITLMQATGSIYEAITDAGVIQFTAVDSPASRSYSSFASGGPYNVTVSPQPTTAVTNQTIDYQQSADGLTWVPTALNNVTARYLQETMTVHS